MGDPKTPEERKDDMFSEIEDRIHAEFAQLGNRWISGINNSLTAIGGDIFEAKEDEILMEEDANRLNQQLREIAQFAKESLADFGDGELPPENLRHKIINKIVDLQYELEQLIPQSE